MQTSTVTVAVLDPDVEAKFALDEREVDIQATRGTGPGGQNRNKVDSCIVATHRPTGIRVRVDMRSQYQSKSMALKILAAKLQERHEDAEQTNRNNVRRAQLGCGARGDKIRTYREVDDRVTDHRTNRTWSFRAWSKGHWQ